MSKPLSRILFFCLILLSFSKLSPAVEDKGAICKTNYRAALENLLHDFDKVETSYIEYRSIENKIRLLTYHDLWNARYQSLDPLSKEMRAGGNLEEDRILEILSKLDGESEKNANAIYTALNRMKDHVAAFNTCCPEAHYEKCISEAFLPIFDKIKTGITLFDGIMERERSYRKAVDLTVGSRKGLYPEDAFEEKSKHADFFKRYEMERRGQRFQEDKDMIYFFYDLRKMLSVSFAGENCCQVCGKTAWQAKADQIFGES